MTMNLNGMQHVRLDDYESQTSFSSKRQWNCGLFSLQKPNLSSIIGSRRRVPETGLQRTKTLRRLFSSNKSKQNILNPQGPFLRKWNRIFTLSCTIALLLDPLFLYTPMVDAKNRCLTVEKNLTIIACVLRSFIDLFYVFRIVLRFRTGLTLPYSGIFRRDEGPKAIARRYLLSRDFVFDMLSILPLPQLVILINVVKAPISLVMKEPLKAVILAQYIPRYFRLCLLIMEGTNTSGLFSARPWAGTAFSLFQYMLASHVLGALWYLMAIQRKEKCWRIACSNNDGCNLRDLYCGIERWRNMSFLDSACPLLEPNAMKNPSGFDFGIFLDALQSNVDEQRNLFKKFLYCLWWGLRNLSSLGQNLKTSTFAGEILFAISVSIIGLILFFFIIGNMAQKCIESITVRLDQMRAKRVEEEQWMSHRSLPEPLRERIRRYQKYKWHVTRGFDEDSLISNLPKDIRRDVRRHLCLSLLIRIPGFYEMDEQLLDSLCSCLKPVLYTENSYIVREGDPVDELLFIIRGKLRTMTTNGFSSEYLGAGDLCGEELLTRALDSNSSTSLPLSERTIRAVEDVEAFCLMLDDLKFAMSQCSQLHRKQLRCTFRFYSRQWRTWAAGFIQKAWRRYRKRKLLKSLQQAEDSPSLVAAIYACRFAANMLANSRRNHLHNSFSSPTLSPLLLQKPCESDLI